MEFYTYVYFDENLAPYYVGEGSRKRYVDRHTVPIPPAERILKFHQENQEAAFAFESYLIKRIGRRPDCCGNRVDEKIGPLMNRTDGGPGASNIVMTAREAVKASAIARQTPFARKLRVSQEDLTSDIHDGLGIQEIADKHSVWRSTVTVAVRRYWGMTFAGLRKSWGLPKLGGEKTSKKMRGRKFTASHLSAVQAHINSGKPAHARYHVNRGILKSDCPLCQPTQVAGPQQTS